MIGRSTFLAISQDDARATKSFASEYGLTFPLVLDADGYPVSNAYGLTMVPTLILADTNGSVLVSSMGFVKADIESIANRFAERAKISKAPLFLPTEPVPAVRPG